MPKSISERRAKLAFRYAGMKKRIILIIVSIVLILIAYSIWKGTGFRFISSETRVSLPYGVSNVKTYDNGEHYIIGFANIPKSKVANFLKDHNFQPLSSKPMEDPMIIWSFFENNKKFPQIGEDSSLYYLTGKRDKWPWEYLLNPETGQLWVFLNYPDYAGN